MLSVNFLCLSDMVVSHCCVLTYKYAPELVGTRHGLIWEWQVVTRYPFKILSYFLQSPTV